MRLLYASIIAVAVSLQEPVSLRVFCPAEHVVGLLAAIGPVEIGRVGRAGVDGQKRQLIFYASGRARPSGSGVTATLPAAPPADTGHYPSRPQKCTDPTVKEIRQFRGA